VAKRGIACDGEGKGAKGGTSIVLQGGTKEEPRLRQSETEMKKNFNRATEENLLGKEGEPKIGEAAQPSSPVTERT